MTDTTFTGRDSLGTPVKFKARDNGDGTASPYQVSVRQSLTFTNLNGVIATGGQAQSLVVASSNLQFLRLANPSNAAESLFFRDDGAAPTGNPVYDEELTPGGEMIWPVLPSAGVQIWAATTGHAFRATKA